MIDSNGNPKVITNSIHTHILKTKLGTKQLPTAELELKDVCTYLVGLLDCSVSIISHILNITSAHGCMGSMVGWCCCLSIAKNFLQEQSVWGVQLRELPLHLSTLVEMELKLQNFDASCVIYHCINEFH